MRWLPQFKLGVGPLPTQRLAEMVGAPVPPCVQDVQRGTARHAGARGPIPLPIARPWDARGEALRTEE